MWPGGETGGVWSLTDRGRGPVPEDFHKFSAIFKLFLLPGGSRQTFIFGI